MVLFPNFSLGEEYEHAPPATNRQISPYLPSGRFRTGLPVEGLAIERGDLFYACPRASVFYGTALDADLRTRGVSTLVMAGISTTGVVLSSVAWASDADYDVRLVQDCCYDPDRDAHEALLRSGFIDRNLNPQKTKKAPQNGCFFNTPCAPYERKRLLNRMTLIDTGYEWRFFAPFPVKWTQLPLCGSQPHTCCRASRSCIRTSSASR